VNGIYVCMQLYSGGRLAAELGVVVICCGMRMYEVFVYEGLVGVMSDVSRGVGCGVEI